MPLVDSESNIETWDKFYSVYMFDEIKYHKLCKERPKLSRQELRKQCYVLDDYGKRIHLGDEKHIFRIQDLIKVQTELANYCKELRTNINYWEQNCSCSIQKEYYTLFYERWDKGTYTYGKPTKKIVNNNAQLNLFAITTESNEYRILQPWDYYAVELKDTWQLPIKTRLLKHLQVLRLCKQGLTLDEACKSVLQEDTI